MLTRQEKYVQNNIAQGKCRYCPRPALPGIQSCAYHTIKTRIKSKKWYELNRDKKIQQVKARQTKLQERGLCISCGTPLNPEFDTAIRCDVCNTRNERARTYQ